MKKSINLALLLTCVSPVRMLYAQEHGDSEERTATYEIIVSGIRTFDLNSKEKGYGSEVHFTYWFNDIWGAGLSYTYELEELEENSQELALLASWNATTWLTINGGPSFILPNENRDLSLAGYLETEFNYRLTKWFHFGPVIGILKGKESKLYGGLQLGFEF